MKTVCASFLIMTAFCTVLILLLYASMRLFGKKLTASCRYTLWRIAIVLLCLPLPLLSPLLAWIGTPSVVQTPMKTVSQGAYSIVEMASGGNVETDTVLPSNKIPQTTPTEASTVEMPSKAAYTPTATETDPAIYPLTIAVIIWGIGAISVFAVSMIRYGRFVISVRGGRDPGLVREADGETKELYALMCEMEGISDPPALFQTNQAISPVLCGLFSRSIVIPDVKLDTYMLASVLSHELVHHRRNDTLWKLAATVAQAVFWFDPAVYLASSELSREAEFSCDEAVVNGMTDDRVTSYCEAILRIVKLCKAPDKPIVSAFHSSKNGVKERFANIMSESRKHKGKIIVVLMLTLCIIAGAAIVGAASGEGKTPDDTADPVNTEVTYVVTEMKPEDETGTVTEEATEAVTEAVAGTVTEEVTEAATEAVIEKVTEDVTEPITAAVTEKVTEVHVITAEVQTEAPEPVTNIVTQYNMNGEFFCNIFYGMGHEAIYTAAEAFRQDFRNLEDEKKDPFFAKYDDAFFENNDLVMIAYPSDTKNEKYFCYFADFGDTTGETFRVIYRTKRSGFTVKEFGYEYVETVAVPKGRFKELQMEAYSPNDPSVIAASVDELIATSGTPLMTYSGVWPPSR